MYQEGDWVVQKSTGRIGICGKKDWRSVSVQFDQAVALLYPDELELAPLDIQEEDILAMQHVAVNSKDRDWFDELGERLGGLKVDKI